MDYRSKMPLASVNNNQLNTTLPRAKRLSLSTRQSIIGGPKLLNYDSTKRRTIGGPGHPTVGYNSATTTISAATKRKSEILKGANNKRRVSMYGGMDTKRVSIYGGLNTTSSFSKDPRPLRDKSYQAMLQQEVHDYLMENKFELEMKYPITIKSLKFPTQKDFVLVFQWLYKRIDPGYKFLKSIEQEVYFLLKTLGYPYIEAINKSQISAVGGSNWPIFLGMLHWLVKLGESLEEIDEADVNQFQIESYTNSVDDNAIAQDDLILDKLFTRYIIKSYKSYLNNEDDYSSFYQEMESDYNVYANRLAENITAMRESNINLNQELTTLQISNEEVTHALKKCSIMKQDLEKFQSYIEMMEAKKLKWKPVLTSLQDELRKSQSEFETLQSIKEKIVAKLREEGFTVEDIEYLNQENTSLSKELTRSKEKMAEITQNIKAKEISASNSFNLLQQKIDSYNSSVYKIINSIGNLEYDVSKFDLEITTFSNKFLNDDSLLGLKPHEIITDIKEKDLKQQQFELKKLIVEKSYSLQDDIIKLQENLDLINESINEQKDQVDSLETNLTESKLLYDEMYETMMNESSKANIELAKLNRDLQSIQLKSKENTSRVNQKYNSIKIEYDQLKHEINRKRMDYQNKVRQILEFVVDFKLGIQSNLEDLEQLVIQECNEELDQVEDSPRTEALQGAENNV
ncbi:Kinetochore-associated Ndc80 complex component [Komagataella phaffii]|uniref:Kinetochore protein NDC80 n=2 Tax=Komagataella phaffii TaxID=460519 RepID=C4QXR3_KOMPG|nr:Component of the evolutionarily conserved kinetochore-associated Ndc80 complex [Komagataella phaffii GS115]AOA61363.1 GQ67_01977T0 [Komagataella phaffii]AOA65768.1 GQ68_01992T0 [Komagataella phaffii GS115]CAY68036.1 Component of the evolutionarily conserved kinetochore-associated Ndc80 complex [Komagataella phaffii GS115]